MRGCTSYLGLAILVVAVSGAEVRAQQSTTTVQLPTFSFFTVNTTVSVPDRGGTYLGGVTRASSGRNSFGAPLGLGRNTGFGQSRSAMQMQVNATIHVMEELDQAVLSQTAPSAPAPEARLVQKLRAAGDSTAGEGAASLADIRRQKAFAQNQDQRDALEQYRKGQAAEVAGKTNVAKIYYKMAARRAHGELRDVIFQQLESLNRPAAQVARQPE